MEHSPAQILQALLTEASGATFTDPDADTATEWPLFVSTLPDTEDTAACLYDTEGVIDARFLASGRNIISHGIQLLIRALDYNTAYAKASETAELLAAVSFEPITLDSVDYTIDTVKQTSPVISLGQDERRRASFSVNLLLMLV